MGPSRNVQNVFKQRINKYMFFHCFWEAFGIGLGTQRTSENRCKHMLKIIDFLMDSGSNFGGILGARMALNCG